jgi:hypothetical protein
MTSKVCCSKGDVGIFLELLEVYGIFSYKRVVQTKVEENGNSNALDMEAAGNGLEIVFW